MRKFFKIVIVGIFLTTFSHSVLATNSLSVVINEIAWMGTEASYNDEWIELYNNSTSVVNLEGWKLISQNGTPEINLEGEILAEGFFLLERTDNEAVLNIEADLIYKGALENGGEYLKLIDSEGKIIDKINCSAGWFAGDNKTKQTMERKDPLTSGNNSDNWQTSQNPGGTPKAENRLTAFQPPEEILPETELEPAAEPQKETEEKLEPIIYPENIFINEMLPSPEGPDAENEWIEIFNGNNFEVDVSGWQIKDTIGATKTYTIPEGTKIKPNGFLVFSRPETKITLQNSGDGLKLLNPNGEIVHEVNYEKAPLGQSFNRTLEGWVWSTTLTPGKENVITQPEISEKKEEKSSLQSSKKEEEPQPSPKPDSEKIPLAKISEELPEKSFGSLAIFLAAIGIAAGSAIIVIILKKRLVGERLETEDKE